MDLVTAWIICSVSLLVFQKDCSGFQVFRNSYVPGGRYLEGVTSPRTCTNYCYYYQTRDKCWGVDFSYKDRRCTIHTDVDQCADLLHQDQSVHYRFLDCDDLTKQTKITKDKYQVAATSSPKEPPPIDSYKTAYAETFINGGSLIDWIKTKEDCYIHCYQDDNCKGLDFDFINARCFFHNKATVCGQLVHKSGSGHLRLDYACDPYNPKECEKTVIQRLPMGLARIGGTKIAEQVEFEACVQICQKSPECKAVDWDMKERFCWEYTTDEFVMNRDCCLHARKVCNDKPQQDAGTRKMLLS